MAKTQALDSNSSKQPRKIWQRVLRAFVVYAVVPYLAVTVAFTTLQRRLLYQPTVADDLSIKNSGMKAESGIDVELTTSDGNTIRGWLLNGSGQGPLVGDKRPLAIYFPGNSLNRRDRINDLREFTSSGFNVLIFDYRGFGDSDGSPSESALSGDALAIWQYAHETLKYDEGNVVVFGESIGGAVALSMWSTENLHPPKPTALILNSTFASMPQTIRWHYPFFPFQYLLLDRWPSIDRISRVESPTIIFHGTNDQMVPVEQGRELAAASCGRFIEVPNGTHNDIPMLQLRKELNSLMRAFVTSKP